jgi:hypothetical protein
MHPPKCQINRLILFVNFAAFGGVIALAALPGIG